MSVDLAAARAAAGSVPDPEVRRSLADLGLLDEVEADGGRVTVRFHLTSPLCPSRFAASIGASHGLRDRLTVRTPMVRSRA